MENKEKEIDIHKLERLVFLAKKLDTLLKRKFG